jgi:NAD(P)-dependent dehydrogenase (short-subunit alcohol dehydrogenase family)
MRNLRGKVAVITGAASGIGRALSVALAKEGCALALADVDEAGLEETAARVRAHGVTVSTHRVDVSDKEQMRQFPQAVIKAHGHAHLLVNNAGVTVSHTVRDMTLEDFEWILGINFWGVVYGCKFFLPWLEKESVAHIVNLSSIFGIIGVPSQSSYCATKFAVRGFTESFRAELEAADSPVHITSVHPGGIDTNIARSARFRQGVFGADTHQDMIEKFRRLAITSPERAANDIVAAIKRDRPRLLIGRDAKLLSLVQRLMPVRYQAVVAMMLGRA